MNIAGAKFKGYIDEKLRVRQCQDCEVVKDFSKFSLNSSGKPRNLCKPCRSYRVGQAFLSKKLDEGSTKHVQCDECCNIQEFVKRSKIQKCKKCTKPIAQEAL